MKRSLLFLPDISGFTNFVQTTEAEHSQHVVAELLEVLINANTLDLQLAEVEGDALFFYKEESIPSLENLLVQVENMFTAFYSHLKMLEANRICPCNACAAAPALELKIIAHSAELQFIVVQDNRKPFGAQVIEAHRLMKNKVTSDNYVLISQELASDVELKEDYRSKLYDFKEDKNTYDGKEVSYLYSEIDKTALNLLPFSQPRTVKFDRPPSLTFHKDFAVSASALLEIITNYSYRHRWVDGVDDFEYNENEVTRIGTEHVCIINGKHFDFVTVTKEGLPGQLVYGELTTSPPPVDALYQFFIITPVNDQSCKLEVQVYWKSKSVIKKAMTSLFLKPALKKNVEGALEKLHDLAEMRTT